MRVLAVFAILVSGCRADVRIPEGVFACSTATVCPPGFVCASGRCWSEVPDASPRDVGQDSTTDAARDSGSPDGRVEDSGRDASDVDVGDSGEVDAGCGNDDDCAETSETMRSECRGDGTCATEACGTYERNCDGKGTCETAGEACCDPACEEELYCASTGECASCVANIHCSRVDAPRCQEGNCGPCVTSADCMHLSASMRCDVGSGGCIPAL